MFWAKTKSYQRYNKIIICLANAHNRCATIDQILECTKELNADIKHPVNATLNTIRRLIKKNMVRRSWIPVGRRKKKRLYCLERLG